MRPLAASVDTSSPVRLVVAAKVAVADGVVTLELRDQGGRRLPSWAPGAHVDLTLPNGLTRQYSLCGDRFDPFRYWVGVLREPDGRGGSGYVHDRLHIGDLVGLGGPRNNFPLVPAPRYLFVTGGIGITPLLSMIAQADALGAHWRLLYGGRTRSSMAFLDELADYGDRVLLLPHDESWLRGELAGALADTDPADTRVYCCGPAPLLAAMRAPCADRPAGHLRTETFVAAFESTARAEPFHVTLSRSGRRLRVGADASVLDALRQAGVPVLSSCQQGVCGTCEVPVLAGVVDHRDSLLSDDERAEHTSMFVCVSRAAGDNLVLGL